MRADGKSPPRQSTGGWEAQVRQRLVPGLTLLYHPDLERVGEWVALPVLARGGAAELSRLVPDFAPAHPDRPGGARRWPLTDAWLSRRPLRLAAAGGGAVLLALDGSRTRAHADGRPVEEARVFPAEAVERGVVLLLSGRVVLLLHRVDPRGAEPRPEGWPAAGSRDDAALGLVGESRPVARLRRELVAAAGGEGPVLLRGEDGTGRERATRVLHRLALTGAGPFLRPGSGDGGDAGADGGDGREPPLDVERLEALVHEARGGLLFLDRVEGLAPPVLRWLVTVLREDAPGEALAGVRLVAGSGAPLERAVAEGRFPAPLLHLLMARPVRLPPLRTCRDDLGRLLVDLLEKEEQREPRLATPRAWLPAPLVARLALHSWPGNLDELYRVFRRLADVRREVTASHRNAAAALAERLAEVLDGELGIGPDPHPGAGPAAVLLRS